ncbi:MAG TPA: patatin-like phospholipase family protein [Rubricoccaceae bacterium]
MSTPPRAPGLFARLFGTAESGAPDDPAPTPTASGGGTALALTGGGARAAYQAGVLRGLARVAPGFRPDLLTGVSAGGLNAAFLAASAHLPFDTATAGLTDVWHDLRAEHVFRLDRPGVAGTLARFVRRPAAPEPPAEGGFLDTTPLHAFVAEHLGPLGAPIARIGDNLAAGHVRGLAITATSYDTGQSVTWVEGGPPDLPGLVRTRIRPEHVLASAALPFFFPAVAVQDDDESSAWYGDGGIRLTAPLSPALRLGADRILSVNTRAAASSAEPSDVYPPASRVLGVLMNAVFLDVLEQDARTLRRINDLLASLPPATHGGFRPVDLLVIRPSEDLARLAGGYEPQLPPSMRVALGRAGAERSPDWLSMLLFDRAYIERLVALGEADVEARADEIRAFLAPGA